MPESSKIFSAILQATRARHVQWLPKRKKWLSSQSRPPHMACMMFLPTYRSGLLVWCVAPAHGWRRRLSGVHCSTCGPVIHTSMMDLIRAASAFAFRPDTQSGLHTHSVLFSGNLRGLDWLFRRGPSSARHISCCLQRRSWRHGVSRCT